MGRKSGARTFNMGAKFKKYIYIYLRGQKSIFKGVLDLV
jgi:hypothetical protein